MRHDEDALQTSVALYLDLRRLLWCHVPNGGYRRKKEAARLKGMGVKPGVPDVLIFEPWLDRETGEVGFGLAIELKVGRNKTTRHQDQWLAALRRRGWKTTVARSLSEAQAFVERWIEGWGLRGAKTPHGAGEED